MGSLSLWLAQLKWTDREWEGLDVKLYYVLSLQDVPNMHVARLRLGWTGTLLCIERNKISFSIYWFNPNERRERNGIERRKGEGISICSNEFARSEPNPFSTCYGIVLAVYVLLEDIHSSVYYVFVSDRMNAWLPLPLLGPILDSY